MSVRKPAILLVDDEPVVRDVFGQALTLHGFEVLLATDGEEGLRAFEEYFDEIDVVVTDIVMPKMDGFEMVRRMFARNPHSKIILMTGFNEMAFIPEGLENICALLRKPFSSRLLTNAVDECLESNRTNRSAVSA
jgi:two-component system, cell cycle sensor histidine kinase and response regulator CckA